MNPIEKKSYQEVCGVVYQHETNLKMSSFLWALALISLRIFCVALDDMDYKRFNLRSLQR